MALILGDGGDTQRLVEEAIAALEKGLETYGEEWDTAVAEFIDQDWYNVIGDAVSDTTPSYDELDKLAAYFADEPAIGDIPIPAGMKYQYVNYVLRDVLDLYVEKQLKRHITATYGAHWPGLDVDEEEG